ncbi:MAG: hypothetical protein C5B58_06585 [Acidobacteria bacterium]|nr:MAG: hypothetical protein C5B58_06585 [Acidobacteriota bacterium]
MGYDPMGNERAFLLTLAPEASTLLLVGIGEVCLAILAMWQPPNRAIASVRCRTVRNPGIWTAKKTPFDFRGHYFADSRRDR